MPTLRPTLIVIAAVGVILALALAARALEQPRGGSPRVVWCDAWGYSMEGTGEWYEPPPDAIEVSPGCYEVWWWQS